MSTIIAAIVTAILNWLKNLIGVSAKNAAVQAADAAQNDANAANLEAATTLQEKENAAQAIADKF